MMYGHEKSDHAIVAGKPTNEAERSAAELVERRAGTEGNAGRLSTRRTQSRIVTAAGVALSQLRFQPGSFGYRPKRTAHDAIKRVAEAIVRRKTRVFCHN